jgi:predicted nucleotidyltransferase
VTDILRLLRVLSDAEVRFIVIGGLAMRAHGSSRITDDVDICYARDSENLERLVTALGPLSPRLRGAPADLPFIFDARTLKAGLNFTFETDIGAIDLLGEVAGLGGFSEANAGAVRIDLEGAEVLVIGLDGLESSKRAAGRKKDLLDLEEIAEIRRQLARLADPSKG